MSDTIISVEHVSKRYRLHHQSRERYTALRDVLTEKVKRLFSGGAREAAPETEEDFWALNDVSFTVKRGEVVGIIGRNGAGKSTLLKILSRITEPSSGRIRIDGRVASLLEVGTGFHPELTGRENIFLNGAILGMTRAEIRRKFDEIVAFAEVEKFLDTPVKRYSSGMYVRLAFAVAAHLEPEILVVDEVLAVGDAEFQKKCLGKIHDVSTVEGRTVLFVSHNMSVVQHLCARVVLMKAGRVVADGPTNTVIGGYLSDARTGSRVALTDWPDRQTTGEARITELEVSSGDGLGSIKLGGDLRIRIHACFETALVDPAFGVIIHDMVGAALLDARSIHDGLRLGRVSGAVVVEMVVPRLGLYPGRYLLSPWIADSTCNRDVDFPRMCASLEVDPAPGPHGDLKLDGIWGKYYAPSAWKALTTK